MSAPDPGGFVVGLDNNGAEACGGGAAAATFPPGGPNLIPLITKITNNLQK